MALRDQPYMPLFVQDFLSDEKLNECSAEAHGIYIKLICLMHKSEVYGKILLEQKYKQNDKPMVNFANKLARHMPFTFDEILSGLNELAFNGVIHYDENTLWQNRMIRDNEISELRASAGSKGGKSTQFGKAKNKANQEAKIEAKYKANTEYENEIENEIENEEKRGVIGGETKVIRKLIYPFESINFMEWWDRWKEYKKKEHRFSFKTDLSEQAALKKLSELAGGDEVTAEKIIEQSIANGYKGLFELRQSSNGTQISQSYKERVFLEGTNSKPN